MHRQRRHRTQPMHQIVPSQLLDRTGGSNVNDVFAGNVNTGIFQLGVKPIIVIAPYGPFFSLTGLRLIALRIAAAYRSLSIVCLAALRIDDLNFLSISFDASRNSASPFSNALRFGFLIIRVLRALETASDFCGLASRPDACLFPSKISLENVPVPFQSWHLARAWPALQWSFGGPRLPQRVR